MKKLTHFVLLAMLVTSLSAQVNVTAPSSIPVHSFVVKGKTAPKILDELAKKYHIIIGIYGSGSLSSVGMPAPIDVKIKDGTLADVFNAIARGNQQFQWQQSSNGAVHFLQGRAFSLMEVTVHSFDYDNPRWPEITDRLRTIPEIHDWLQD
jgi:hypothetical protein